MATMDPLGLPLYQQRTLTPPSTATLSPGPGKANAQLYSSLSATFTNDRSPKTFLPRTALRNSPNHTTNFQQLLFLRECFHKSEFWDEVAILDRMHYKNKNQHRQAGYFQRLSECRRIVARIRELNVGGLVDEFVQKFYSGRRAFYQLMSKTQFMAFALIAIGLCSRLSLLSKAWAKEYVDCYRLLQSWMKTFPEEGPLVEEVDYESHLPESIDSILVASSLDIPNTQLPSTSLYQSADDSPEPTPAKAEALSLDLGEVIQRKELLSLALTAESVLSSGASPKPFSAWENKLLSPLSLKPELNQELQVTIEASDQHSSLLDELDTIFGSKSSTAVSSSISTKKQEKKPLPNLNDIFKNNKKQKSKDKKPTGSGTGVSSKSSPMSSAPSTPGSRFSSRSKSSTGSKSNFDSIFDFKRGSSSSSASRDGFEFMPASPSSGKKGDSSSKVRKDKKEIGDIFGSIKKPKKTVSEIDSIFGPPKKKKKAP
ncbi:hypothetical protein BGZ47_007488 [Haplosporangium gracile]|nr:hypothetical protein BGZ47_007488 [Haplosporangium gracile]